MKLKGFFKERLTLLLSVLFLTYIFFLHAPFEIFLTNRENFWFDLSDFGWLVGLMFISAFLLCFIVGAFLPKKLRDIYSVLAFSGGLCVYIQGNFLNIDFGTLNGSEIIWSDYKSKFIINAIIWVAIIVAALVLYFILKKKTVKVLSALSAFVLLIQIVTLSTLFISGASNKAPTVDDGQYALTDKDLYTVSKDENVIFFLLDMFDNEYMRKIISEKPEVKETFKDFTFFDNAVGSYSTTCYCVGTLLTGQPVNNQGADFNSSVDIAYKDTKIFNDLAEEDFLFDIYVADGYVPYELRKQAQNYEMAKISVSNNYTLVKRIYRLVTCRFAPDFVKQKYWMDGTEFLQLKTIENSENKAYSDKNLTFYQGLKDNGLKLSDDKRFKFIHLAGTHYPYEIDSQVNPIPATSSPDQALDTAKGVLKIVEEYIDELKSQGVYKNSTIVLVADHGFYLDGVLTNPLIMIKKSNVNTDFTVSNAPVSHYDLHATIMDSLNLNTDEKYGKSMFDIKEGEQRNRLFYQYSLQEGSTDAKFRLIEWKVDDANNKRKSFQLTGYEYDPFGVRQNHFDTCEYCIKNGTEPVDAPNSETILHSPKK